MIWQALYLSFDLDIDSNEDTDQLPFARVDDLINSHCWNNLRIVRLHCSNCTQESATAFLVAHPTLEQLQVDDYFGVTEEESYLPESIILPAGVLPNIRRLACPVQYAVAILSSPLPFPRPIEHISEVNATHSQGPRFLDLLSQLSTLRRLDLAYSDGLGTMEVLSQASRNLVWLELGVNPREDHPAKYSDRDRFPGRSHRALLVCRKAILWKTPLYH